MRCLWHYIVKSGNLKGKTLSNYKETVTCCFETRNSFQGAYALTIVNEIQQQGNLFEHAQDKSAWTRGNCVCLQEIYKPKNIRKNEGSLFAVFNPLLSL